MKDLKYYLQYWVKGYASQILDLDILSIIMTLGGIMLILMLVLYMKSRNRKWYFRLKGLKQLYVQLIFLSIIFHGFCTAAVVSGDDALEFKIGDLFLRGIVEGLFENLFWLFLSFIISVVLFVFGIIHPVPTENLTRNENSPI
ncbi:MAG: hypothetical protein K8S55_02025 [Phycisphaerae bacterium]|nr:hypothetical protein [Phycisphaerae bacterium]